MMSLDHSIPLPDNLLVPFNSGTGFSRLINLADTRHPGGFFSSVHRYSCVQFMAGGSGETFGSAGSKFRSANPATCLPPPFSSGRQAIKTNLEATMPKLRRALRALFPVFAVPVTTLPTLAEARALAALLVSRGKRVAIQPATTGFTVSEVAA